LKNKVIAGRNSSCVSFSTTEERNKIICLFIGAAIILECIASSFKMTVNGDLEIMRKEALMA
jgi:hypothetical protein